MTQTVPDISPLMPMHQDPLLVYYIGPRQSEHHLKIPFQHIFLWLVVTTILMKMHWDHFIDDKPTLDKVMAWCHQALTHCLVQCWPKCHMTSLGRSISGNKPLTTLILGPHQYGTIYRPLYFCGISDWCIFPMYFTSGLGLCLCPC